MPNLLSTSHRSSLAASNLSQATTTLFSVFSLKNQSLSFASGLTLVRLTEAAFLLVQDATQLPNWPHQHNVGSSSSESFPPPLFRHSLAPLSASICACTCRLRTPLSAPCRRLSPCFALLWPPALFLFGEPQRPWGYGDRLPSYFMTTCRKRDRRRRNFRP